VNGLELIISMSQLKIVSSYKVDYVLNFQKHSYDKIGLCYIEVGSSTPSSSKSSSPKDKIVFVPSSKKEGTKNEQSRLSKGKQVWFRSKSLY
jgi:hypothetical protein